jgi:hypothetical protein
VDKIELRTPNYGAFLRPIRRVSRNSKKYLDIDTDYKKGICKLESINLLEKRIMQYIFLRVTSSGPLCNKTQYFITPFSLEKKIGENSRFLAGTHCNTMSARDKKKVL